MIWCELMWPKPSSFKKSSAKEKKIVIVYKIFECFYNNLKCTSLFCHSSCREPTQPQRPHTQELVLLAVRCSLLNHHVAGYITEVFFSSFARTKAGDNLLQPPLRLAVDRTTCLSSYTWVPVLWCIATFSCMSISYSLFSCVWILPPYAAVCSSCISLSATAGFSGK